jgi:hypothetical protein
MGRVHAEDAQKIETAASAFPAFVDGSEGEIARNRRTNIAARLGSVTDKEPNSNAVLLLRSLATMTAAGHFFRFVWKEIHDVR